MVNKADIKRRVMDNQLGPFNKRPEIICDLGKDRFISHFGIVNAMWLELNGYVGEEDQVD